MMKTVYVQFKNKNCNYTTSANGTDEEIEQYFVGAWFNLKHISNKMQQCIAVTITEQ